MLFKNILENTAFWVIHATCILFLYFKFIYPFNKYYWSPTMYQTLKLKLEKQNKIKYGPCLYGVLQSKEAIIVQCINEAWYSLQKKKKKKTPNFKNLDLQKENLTQL